MLLQIRNNKITYKSPKKEFEHLLKEKNDDLTNSYRFINNKNLWMKQD